MTRKRHMLVVMLMAMAAIGIGGNSAFAAGTHQVPFQGILFRHGSFYERYNCTLHWDRHR